jgi:phosphocarrier protein HPr
MNLSTETIAVTVSIRQAEGWHARPATEFASIVSASGLTVTIGRPDQPPMRGDSVLSLLTLGAKFGEELVLEVAGGSAEDQKALLESLLALF